MGKKIMPLLFGIILLGMLAGCGGGGGPAGGDNPGGGNPPAGSDSGLTIHVYDKLSGTSLNSVSLKILEANTDTIIVNGTYKNPDLSSGRYSIYLSKQGYITRGYIVNLAQALTIKAYLELQDYPNQDCTVGGVVLESNGTTQYSGSFNYYVGDKYVTNSRDTDTTISNPFSTSSVPGNIVTSVFSQRAENSSIDKIVYERISLGESKTDLRFILPENSTSYSGSKLSNGNMIVKTGDGYYLASEDSTETDFSFGVNLLSGDALTLESRKVDDDGGVYFVQVPAVSGGNVNDLTSFPTGLPRLSIAGDNSFYTFTLGTSDTGFASFYEIDGTTGSDAEVKDLFQIVCLNGTSVKIPKTLFGSETSVDIHVRAMKMDGYDAVKLLNNTQSYQSYAYTEVIQSLNNGPSGTYSFRMLNAREIGSNKFTQSQVRRYQFCLE